MRDRTFLMENLEKANRIRSARAEWKRGLSGDRSLILEALTDPPEWLLSARVLELLLAVPKFGPVKVRHIVKGAGISQATTVGGLTDRQKAMLRRELESRLT